MDYFKDFSVKERKLLNKLNTPVKIQEYLDKLPMNFSDEDPCFCPVNVMRERKAHCLEGALLAAAALWYHGQKPLLMDMEAVEHDEDHVVTLFKVKGYWGAISKTNHGMLRYREPIYRTVRELAMSYFNEYYTDSGEKTLRKFSAPFNLAKYQRKYNWLTSREGLLDLVDDLCAAQHFDMVPKHHLRKLRLADPIERELNKTVEWKRPQKTRK